jgi:chitodextrinase
MTGSKKKLTLQSRCIVAFLLGLVPLVSSSPALAQSGSPPKNLRVIGVTDWTVSLAWDAPTGKAPASYVVQCSNGRSMTVPGSQTTATFSSGFDYNRTYSFRAYAVSSNGSWSGASNTVTATLLKDTTPPTKPVVNATDIGPTHVDLAWSCFDASPNLRFDVYRNGSLLYGQIAGTTKRIVFLSPSTTYTFTVRARDSGGNWSEMSDPFVVTTPPADPNDHEPPTMPPGFGGGIIDGATEAMVFFGASTDNVTPQEHIGYTVYLNGVFDGTTIDPYPHQFTLYLTPGIVNTIEVYAVDEAGNRSTPATMIIDMRTP